MSKRIAAIVVGALLVSSATVAAASALRSDSASADAALTGTAQQTRDYYASARASLSPLIVHVRDLPQSLAALSAGKKPAGGLGALASTWVEDCANARDLVNRVPVPAGPAGAHIGSLYATGAMLYTEASRLVVSAVEADSKQRTRADAALGQRLVVLGDRLFDSAYRLLNSTGALTASELHFPGAVPDFATSSTGAVAPQLSEPVGIPVTDWARAHGADVRALGTTLFEPGDGAVLTERQLALAVPVADPAGHESVIGMRLAAVTLAEAVNRRAAGTDDVVTQRLALLVDRIWSSSVRLFPTDDFRDLAERAPADDSALFIGGYFNGRPPALAPGSDPGQGLPGGLPALDSQALLGS